MFSKTIQILVVDDMSTMRRVVLKMLSDLGFGTPLTAENGKDALEILKDSKGAKTQLIISDWNMPEMSGLELLKTVRSDAHLKKLPFMMLTAESEDSQRAAAVAAGVDTYLTKPFTKMDFEKALQDLFTHSQKRAA